MSRRKQLAAAAGALGALASASAHAREFFNFQTPVTPIAHEVLFIHDLFLAIIVTIFVIVCGLLMYSLAAHRRSRHPEAATFVKPRGFKQWAWTIVPFLILVFIDYVVLGIPAFRSILALADTAHSQMSVVVTGSQWKWQYAYPGYGIKFTSALATPQAEIDDRAPKDRHFLLEVDHPLVLPTHEKIRLVIASRDVIHAFWVPSFGIKQDAVPGYLRYTWVKIEKPGVYRGQCAELCGVGHAFMPIVVVAKPKAEFARWVAKEQLAEAAEAKANRGSFTMAQLLAKGEKGFRANCAACHQVTGLGIPGTFPPIATDHPFSASPAMLAKLRARGFYKDGKIVEGPVKHHIQIVLHGISGTAMPAFADQLDDATIAAIITYERNAFGNHTGEMIQPAEVRAARATH